MRRTKTKRWSEGQDNVSGLGKDQKDRERSSGQMKVRGVEGQRNVSGRKEFLTGKRKVRGTKGGPRDKGGSNGQK